MDTDNDLNNNYPIDDINFDDISLDDPVVAFDKKQHYIDMISAHKQGDTEKAANIFSDILAQKTTEMLSGWYHIAGDLKSHLNTPKSS